MIELILYCPSLNEIIVMTKMRTAPSYSPMWHLESKRGAGFVFDKAVVESIIKGCIILEGDWRLKN